MILTQFLNKVIAMKTTTLEKLLVPNSYGTEAIIDIPGIGHIKRSNNGYIELLNRGGSRTLDSNNIKVNANVLSHNRIQILDEKLLSYTARLRYLKIATAEERIIASALDSNAELYYVGADNLFRTVNLRCYHEILLNGTGWLSEAEAVTFYFNDLLHELDLKDKLP